MTWASQSLSVIQAVFLDSGQDSHHLSSGPSLLRGRWTSKPPNTHGRLLLASVYHLRQLKQSHTTIWHQEEEKSPAVEAKCLLQERLCKNTSQSWQWSVWYCANSHHSTYPSVSAWSFYSASHRARENHSSNSYLSCPSFSCFSKTGEKWWPWSLCEV